MTTCTTDTTISLRNVHKKFKSVHAVNDISLDIQRGEYVAVLGPNGAGKTTLVEMIEGLQKPDTGKIMVLNKAWAKHERFLRERLGIALQETRLIDKLTVLETLNLFASFYGKDKNISRGILNLLGLQEKQNSIVETCSGGQKQKLALGIAIINQPEVLILDEPTIGLDPHARREMWGILRELKKRCTTLVLTTHYMEEAESLCDRIFIIHKGRILTQGTLKELLAHHGNSEVIEFSLAPNQNPAALSKLKGVLKSNWNDAALQGTLEVNNAADFLPVFFATVKKKSLDLLSLTSRKKTLDDLFIQLTGKRLDEE
ncbi:ABC transporter ATP-binding protein [bacterium]|nr:ABC transporter ATP-binding protein [bacterium]